jgi:hypothetical protein
MRPIRAVQSILGLGLGVGSLVLWLGIPAGWLWIFSHATDNYFDIYLGTLAAAPPTMIAWGWFLHRLNRMYLTMTETGDRSGPRRRHHLLETFMTISVLAAILAFLAWIVFLGPAFHLPAQGAW